MHEQPHGYRLPLLGLLIGLWAIVPPYASLFGKLEVKSAAVEFVDHVVPGAVVIAVAVLGYIQLRPPEPSQLVLFVGGVVITLAGFWMLSTHVGLINQTREGDVPGGALAWHGLPGIAVTLLGVAWTVRFWATDDATKETSVGR